MGHCKTRVDPKGVEEQFSLEQRKGRRAGIGGRKGERRK